MPREISIFGVLAPSLLLVFLLAVVIHVGVDWLCGHFGIYKHVWHRSLFRLCPVSYTHLTLPTKA